MCRFRTYSFFIWKNDSAIVIHFVFLVYNICSNNIASFSSQMSVLPQALLPNSSQRNDQLCLFYHDYNSTTTFHYEFAIGTFIFGLSAGTLVFIFGTFANAWVLLSACSASALRTPTFALLINLAVSDLLLCMIGVPAQMVTLVLNYHGQGASGFCNFVTFITSWMSLNTVITLAAISVERLYCVLRVFSDNGRKTIAIFGIVFSWLVAAIHATFVTIEGKGSPFFQKCACLPKEQRARSEYSISTNAVITLGVVCLSVTVAAYVSIAIVIRRESFRARSRIHVFSVSNEEQNMGIEIEMQPRMQNIGNDDVCRGYAFFDYLKAHSISISDIQDQLANPVDYMDMNQHFMPDRCACRESANNPATRSRSVSNQSLAAAHLPKAGSAVFANFCTTVERQDEPEICIHTPMSSHSAEREKNTTTSSSKSNAVSQSNDGHTTASLALQVQSRVSSSQVVGSGQPQQQGCGRQVTNSGLPELKAAKRSAVLITVFIGCWLPFIIVYLCKVSCRQLVVCMYVCMHVCMNACMYVCMYVCMHACMHACMYECMYVCM